MILLQKKSFVYAFWLPHGLYLYGQDGGEVEVSGSPTEKAILSWAVKAYFSFYSAFHFKYDCLVRNFFLLTHALLSAGDEI